MHQLKPLVHKDGPVFQDAWQAQVLAMADSLIAAGKISGSDWANTLGDKLRIYQTEQDTIAAYYAAALDALETLLDEQNAVSRTESAQMKSAWTRAYEVTPHGQPVVLADGSADAGDGRT